MIARLAFLLIYLAYLPFLFVGLLVFAPLLVVSFVGLVLGFVAVLVLMTCHDALLAGVQK